MCRTGRGLPGKVCQPVPVMDAHIFVPFDRGPAARCRETGLLQARYFAGLEFLKLACSGKISHLIGIFLYGGHSGPSRPIRPSSFCQSEPVQGPEKRCFFWGMGMDLSAGGDAAGPPVRGDPPGVLGKIMGRQIPIRACIVPRSGKVVQRSLYRGRIVDGLKRKKGGFGWGGFRRRFPRGGGDFGILPGELKISLGNFCKKFSGFFFEKFPGKRKIL
jgi:hypothetical protein